MRRQVDGSERNSSKRTNDRAIQYRASARKSSRLIGMEGDEQEHRYFLIGLKTVNIY